MKLFVLKTIEFFLNVFNYFVRQTNKQVLASIVKERLDTITTVTVAQKKLRFNTPNSLTHWRAKTLLTKEPETIAWIQAFSPQGVFYDVGANVGPFTLFAATVHPHLKVFSFEPAFNNYSLLNENIALNNLSNVQAFNLAISQRNEASKLFMPELTPGGALNNFGSAVDLNKKNFSPAFQQSVLGFSLDALIKQFALPLPNYLKIDVDGLEAEIIKGGIETLKSPQLTSLLIELNDSLESDRELITIIESLGLKFVAKKQSEEVKNSEFSAIFNYIFKRS